METGLNILLYSGGIDSFIGYYYLKHHIDGYITPIYFDIGHRYSNVEIEYIKRYRPETIIVDGNRFGKVLERLDAHIPNRNALLILLADSYFSLRPYKNKTIYIGGLKDDSVEDNSKAFAEAMTNLLQVLHPKTDISVKSVFNYELTKKEIVDWYRSNINQTDLVKKTFSCYQPIPYQEDPHCYSCSACFRRNVALADIEVLPFYDEKLLNEYFMKAIEGKKYPKERNDAIINYVVKWRELYKN